MKHPALTPALALASAFLLPAVAAADDLADLSGAWTCEKPTRYPGTALFYGEAAAGDGAERYTLALIQREGGAIETTKLAARWDGETLVLTRGASDAAGLAGALGGALGTAAGSTGDGDAEKAVYTFGTPGPLDLERLTHTAGDLDGVRLPSELRRPRRDLDPEADRPWDRPVRAPAEWEEAEEILWGARDAFKVVDIYAAAITATHANGEAADHRVYAVNQTAEAQIRAEFAIQDVPLDRVYFHVKEFGSVWIRDFGPITLKERVWNQDGSALVDGDRIVGDIGYYEDRPEDDSIPYQYARARHWAKRNIDSLKIEGGNFLTDGKGRVFTTTRTYEDGINPSQEHVEDRLLELGAREVFFLERMPEPEGTGHIDMFAKLLDADTVLVGSCDDQPVFGAVLDRNAARFEAYGYDVVRVPMASGPELQTYTNSLFVGNTVLVPTYQSPRDEPALETYRDHGWNAVGIDCRVVIEANGAIHCISMQIPR